MTILICWIQWIKRRNQWNWEKKKEKREKKKHLRRERRKGEKERENERKSVWGWEKMWKLWKMFLNWIENDDKLNPSVIVTDSIFACLSPPIDCDYFFLRVFFQIFSFSFYLFSLTITEWNQTNPIYISYIDILLCEKWMKWGYL